MRLWWASVQRQPVQRSLAPTQQTAYCGSALLIWMRQRQRRRRLPAARQRALCRWVAGCSGIAGGQCRPSPAAAGTGAPVLCSRRTAPLRHHPQPPAARIHLPLFLQRKALGLLRRMAAWYRERPQVQQEAAQAEAAQQRFGSGPERRKAAERMAAELAAEPGQPLCPCGCGQVSRPGAWGVWRRAICWPITCMLGCYVLERGCMLASFTADGGRHLSFLLGATLLGSDFISH